MPWLTPDSIPEGDICRPLSIPADTIWPALVSGALTELVQKYNWQKFGSLTVDETVAKMQQIVDGYYADPCGSGCSLPGGGKIIRIGEGGLIQELDDGVWTDATGDYVIPPPDARTGGTVADENCLAAENAVNVLHTLYDDLSSSWTSHLSEAEALTSFTLALIGAVGFEFAPVTAGIVAFFGVAFTALYEALAYLGADLWDDAVSKQITCFLLACAANTDGVVTFDWDCFLAKLNSLTDDFLLSETQLRLYLQITYILYFIGGVAGLNLAGGTTAIDEAHCEECTGWYHAWNGCNDPAWDFFPSDTYGGGHRGAFSSGEWVSSNGPTSSEILMRILFPVAADVSRIQVTFAKVVGSFDGAQQDAMIYDSPNGYYDGTGLTLTLASTNVGPTWGWDGTVTINTELTFWMFAASASSVTYGTVTITKIEMWGPADTDPFGESC